MFSPRLLGQWVEVRVKYLLDAGQPGFHARQPLVGVGQLSADGLVDFGNLGTYGPEFGIRLGAQGLNVFAHVLNIATHADLQIDQNRQRRGEIGVDAPSGA